MVLYFLATILRPTLSTDSLFQRRTSAFHCVSFVRYQHGDHDGSDQIHDGNGGVINDPGTDFRRRRHGFLGMHPTVDAGFAAREIEILDGVVLQTQARERHRSRFDGRATLGDVVEHAEGRRRKLVGLQVASYPAYS